MARIIIYSPSDPTVADRVIHYLIKADTPAYDGEPNKIVNPDLTALSAVLKKYWKYDGTSAIVEMTAQEKIDIDAFLEIVPALPKFEAVAHVDEFKLRTDGATMSTSDADKWIKADILLQEDVHIQGALVFFEGCKIKDLGYVCVVNPAGHCGPDAQVAQGATVISLPAAQAPYYDPAAPFLAKYVEIWNHDLSDLKEIREIASKTNDDITIDAIVNGPYGKATDQDPVINIQTDDTLDPGTPTTGDRYLLKDTAALHANFGTITGVGDDDIVEYDGDDFIVDMDASATGSAKVKNSNDTTFHDWDGTDWAAGTAPAVLRCVLDSFTKFRGADNLEGGVRLLGSHFMHINNPNQMSDKLAKDLCLSMRFKSSAASGLRELAVNFVMRKPPA